MFARLVIHASIIALCAVAPARNTTGALLGTRMNHAGTQILETGEWVEVYHLFLGFDEWSHIFNVYDFDIEIAGELYQSLPPFGSETPPNSGYYGIYPDLRWDTYVTIGVADTLMSDDTKLDPSFGIEASRVHGGWYDILPYPTPTGVTDHNNEVFIGQFSVYSDSVQSANVFTGVGSVTYKHTEGRGGDVYQDAFLVGSESSIPAPGSICLVVAGFALASRRIR